MSKTLRPRRRRPTPQPQPTPRPRRDERFNELLDLAREGNADAIADLWREYGFNFEREEP